MIDSNNLEKLTMAKILHYIQSYKIDKLNKLLNINHQAIPKEKIQLTKREEQVLFLLSMGKSPKEIANIFSNLDGKKVAQSTVSSIINKQLYTKFGVFGIGKLIEKATLMNLIPILPNSFI